jgi:hypothetical protein
MPQPEVVDYEIWRPNRGKDPAKYLIDPGSVTAPGKHSAGMLRHARPYLVAGDTLFIFPVGVEGFRRSGQSQLGLHRYIGDNSVDGMTIHLEEARIELTGTFPGTTAQDNMVNCINILRAPTKEPGLILYAPGVFEMEQYVLPENWDFSHDRDDRTHSIDYVISLVRIGEGRKVKDIPGKPPPPQPGRKIKPKGKPSRIWTVKAGAQTLRAVAKLVYGDAESWKRLVQLNQGLLTTWNKTHPDIPNHQLPTFRWPVGTKLRY